MLTESVARGACRLAKEKMLPRKAERAANDAFEMHDGWLLNFGDATMERWFDEEFNLDLNQMRYHRIGASKAKRLREFVLVEPPTTRLLACAVQRCWNTTGKRRFRLGQLMVSAWLSVAKRKPASARSIREKSSRRDAKLLT